MFKKLKASIGIGAVSVDTVLNNANLYQGELLTGVVHIKGGEVEQHIDSIMLKLCTQVKHEHEHGEEYQQFILAHLNANNPLTIQAGENKEIPFEFILPNETPITNLQTPRNHCKVWLETTLDIDFSIDPKDRDYLEILPLPAVQLVLQRLELEGFRLIKADVEKGFLNGGNFQSKSGCYQELEFQNKEFFNKKEVELSFILDKNKIHCLAEIDRHSEKEDIYRTFTLNKDATEAEIDKALAQTLRS